MIAQTATGLEDSGMHIQWPGLFFMAWGTFALLTSVLHPEAYRWNLRSHVVEAFLGKIGTRLFFGVLGTGLIVFGTSIFIGVIRPADERARVSIEDANRSPKIVSGRRYVSSKYGFSIAFPVGWARGLRQTALGECLLRNEVTRRKTSIRLVLLDLAAIDRHA
jgi:hypothetical protein